MSLSAAPLTLRGTLVPFTSAPSDPQCRVALEQSGSSLLFAILPRGAGIDLDDMFLMEVAEGAVLQAVLAHDGLSGGGHEGTFSCSLVFGGVIMQAVDPVFKFVVE